MDAKIELLDLNYITFDTNHTWFHNSWSFLVGTVIYQRRVVLEATEVTGFKLRHFAVLWFNPQSSFIFFSWNLFSSLKNIFKNIFQLFQHITKKYEGLKWLFYTLYIMKNSNLLLWYSSVSFLATLMLRRRMPTPFLSPLHPESIYGLFRW